METGSFSNTSLSGSVTAGNPNLAGASANTPFLGLSPQDFSFFNLLFSLSTQDDTLENKSLIEDFAQSNRKANIKENTAQQDNTALLAAKLRDRRREEEKKIPVEPEQLTGLTGINPLLLFDYLKQSNATDNVNLGNHKNANDDNFQMSLRDVFVQPNIPIQLPLHQLQQLPQYIGLPKSDGNFSKTQGLSQDFMDLVQKAYQKQRSIRVSVSDDTALILKFNRQGQVSAQFLTHDAASELFLRQQLSELRQRLDEKGLPVDKLTVSSHDQGQKKQENDRNSQEKDT